MPGDLVLGPRPAAVERLGDRGVILGIALDGVVNLDPHEDTPGGDSSGKPAPSLESITAKVNRAVSVSVGALREALAKVYHADRIVAELKN